MTLYTLEWAVEIEADTPEEAAKRAYRQIRKTNGGVWGVWHYGAPRSTKVTVDLEYQMTNDVPWVGEGE